MSFIAEYDKDFTTWDYLTGDNELSIVVDRYYFLWGLNDKNALKISLRDPSTDYWTKWCEFPGLLLNQSPPKYGQTGNSHLAAAIDVHRSVLSNEIVIESDYPTYEENYEASKVIGEILESKGFKPLYYYSGNKSVHIHVFFDWNCLKELDPIVQDQLRLTFNDSKLRFQNRFMKWLRTKMISCWDTELKQFDTDLINPKHLIRCELSRNKLGYKTFLGYTHKDMSFIPYICNEKNRLYPKIGKIRLSSPNNVQELIEEFIEEIAIKTKKEKAMKKNRSLGDWGMKGSPIRVRECVRAILSDDFKKYGDGFKRGMFILANELRAVYGDSHARIAIHEWNSKMDFPVSEVEIEYRMKIKRYSLSCKYIHKFLKELGINVDEKCKGKL